MSLKTKLSKKRAVVSMIFVVSIAVFVFMTRLSMQHTEFIALGNSLIPTNSVMGSIQVVLIVLCIGMVLVEHKLGYTMAIVVLVTSILSSLRATIMSPNHESLPGTINSTVFVLIITIIYRQILSLSKESHTDFVTGLYNRRGMSVKIAEAIERKKPFDLVSIEIKEFDLIGDELGYECTDDVIREIARRMIAVLGDKAVVSHFDMTTFSFILPSSGDTIKIVSDIIRSITQRITVEKAGTPVNCHIFAYAGISSFPKDAENMDELIKYSNISMHHCSRNMKHYLEVFDDDIKKQYLRDGVVEMAIKEAIDAGSLYPVYQPQYEAMTKKLVGFETLSRLTGPDGEFIPAHEFISVAERTDLITFIDYYVLKKAIWQFTNIYQDYGADIVLSVNLSAKTIASVGIVDYIMGLLKDAQFPKECFEIEVTEYSFINQSEMVVRNIKALSSEGVKIAVDDFGSGYTSLSNFSKLPIDIMKIDKSIVDDIEIDPLKKDIVDSVIYIGHLLKCKVVCEGVERLNQVDILRSLDCDIIQGFIWGRPMIFDEAKNLIKEKTGDETIKQ